MSQVPQNQFRQDSRVISIVYSQPPVIDGTAHLYANQAIATNERRNQLKYVKIF
jgi:hypothetical protein